MMKQMEQIYLGRSMREWLTDFYSAEYVEGMELLGPALLNGPVEALIQGCDAYSPCDTNLMCAALSSFGMALIEAAIPMLANLESRKQVRLILCIADTGQESIPYLVQLLEHSSPNVRAAACLGLVRSLDSKPSRPPETVQRLADILHRLPQSQAEWVEAFEGLEVQFFFNEDKRCDDTEILTSLVLRTEDQDPTVRMAAIKTLFELGRLQEADPNPALVNVLLSVFRDDPLADVRKVALQQLAQIEDVEYVQHLTRSDIAKLLQVLDDADPAVRENAAAIIQHLQATRVVAVASIIQNAEPDLQPGPLAACELLAMVSEFVPQLMAKLDDDRAQVRACAAGALARVNKRFGWTTGRRDELVPALARLLQDRVCEVRVAAVRALTLLKRPSQPDVEVILAEAAKHQDEAVRSGAKSALQGLSDELVDMDYKDPDEQPSRGQAPTVPESVRTLQEKCRQLAGASVDVVIEALHDRDIAIRLAAVRAVEKFDGPEQDVKGHLVGLLQDVSPQVRWSTESALVAILVKRSSEVAGQCR